MKASRTPAALMRCCRASVTNTSAFSPSDDIGRVASRMLSTTLGDALAYGTAACSTDRKSTRLNSCHSQISYAVFCLKKKNSIAPRHVLSRTHRVNRALLHRLVIQILTPCDHIHGWRIHDYVHPDVIHVSDPSTEVLH